MVKVGQVFEKVQVKSKIFGNSYLVTLMPDMSDSPVGFLHKSNIPRHDEEEKIEQPAAGDADGEKDQENPEEDKSAAAVVEETPKKRTRKGKKFSELGVGTDKDDLL